MNSEKPHPMKTLATILLPLVLFIVSSPALCDPIVLDPASASHTFDGLGALSAGASSRLLIDYPEPQRSEVLDYLFKPNFGAALQHLKVEIGGDADSTDGTEPSIARTREECLHPKPEYFNRGYEWWLMKEAKKRNPRIIFDVLQWGAPGWIGNGKFYSQDNADFIVAFIKGAKKYHDLEIRYCGVWNERHYDVQWIKLLRRTLNANDLGDVQIVAADEVNKWTIADKMAKDPALRDAVQIIGTHYPKFKSTPIARSFRKSLWASEEGPWSGKWGVKGPVCLDLAQSYNRNYIVGHMTKSIVWSPVSSYYDILIYPGSGLMYANQPWSGHYEVQPAIWITAHTTQFIQPGWKYLGKGACSLLDNGGSRVAAISPDGKDFSIVIETLASRESEQASFRLAGELKPRQVQVWKSTATAQFIRQPDLPLANGTFHLIVEPQAIYSITSTAGQSKGIASPIPDPKPMPLPYTENFDTYDSGKTPRYLSNFYGVFETAVAPDGRPCLEQKLSRSPISWVSKEGFPVTLAGDVQWQDYTVSCDIRIDFKQKAQLLGRIETVTHGGFDACKGYSLTVTPDGQWELAYPGKILIFGKTRFTPGAWLSLGLRFKGNRITALIDGKEIGSVQDGKFKRGLIGVGCQYEPVRFSRLRVEALAPVQKLP